MLQLPTAETFYGPKVRRSLGRTESASDRLTGDDRWRQLAQDADTPIALWPLRLYGDSTMLPERIDADSTVSVHVRHGRWLATCECGEAQYASELDRRFYCLTCHNAISDGAIRETVWPDQSEAIEHAIAKRPRNRQNWLPHESLQHLNEQNDLLHAWGEM